MFKKAIFTALALLLISAAITGCMKNKSTSVETTPIPENNKPAVTDKVKPEEKVVRADIGKRNGIVDVKWTPPVFEKKVAAYKVKSDLSNIANIKQFGSFTKEQKALLSKNGFVVMPTNEEQLFFIYERNEYLKIPSFITTDSVLQVYHLFFDSSLRKLEEEKLSPILIELTDNMLNASIKQYTQIKNPVVKNAALKNSAYFAVAQKLLGKKLSKDIPKNVTELAEKEYLLVSKGESFTDSNIFPYMIDYSQFTVRGHYTKNDTLKKYFKASMWYGLVPFAIANEKKNKDQVLQGSLISQAVFNSNENKNLWDKIYDITSLYVGASDDITIYHFKDMLKEVYGSKPDLEKLDDITKFAALNKLIKELPEPQIKGKVAAILSDKIPVGKQLRFMGQRYIADSEILQELTTLDKDSLNRPIRPIPKGLDVMGVFGSERASNILNNLYKEPLNWNKYLPNFNALKTKFSKLPEKTWRSNIYYGWLWTLKSLIGTYEEGYPSFMRTQAWQDKSLSTALASWSELRHDTVLYGKQSMAAECGGFEEPPPPKGYVEPNIETYQRLKWLTTSLRKNLEEKQLLSTKEFNEFSSKDVKNNLIYFENLLDFLTTCSIKELKNQELTEEEYRSIRIYGGTLEGLTLNCTDVEKWYQIESETEKSMAVISDVHTYNSQYLEEGVGLADEIYTVVPIKGKLYLTRGAVFSYYEFENNKRLTDEEWLKIIKGKKPNQPEWIKSFKNQEKMHVIPVPAVPFSSGC